MNKSLIMVFGKICSGKNHFCQDYIAKGYKHIITSDIVKQLSGHNKRSDLTDTGNLDIQIANQIIKQIDHLTIIDGIRQSTIVDHILQNYDGEVSMIWLTADCHVRRQRFEQRNDAKDDYSFDQAEQGDIKLGLHHLEQKYRFKCIEVQH